jgi:hypothetical protein
MGIYTLGTYTQISKCFLLYAREGKKVGEVGYPIVNKGKSGPNLPQKVGARLGRLVNPLKKADLRTQPLDQYIPSS